MGLYLHQRDNSPSGQRGSRILYILVAALLSTSSLMCISMSPALGCPGGVLIADLAPKPVGPRHELRMFAKRAQGSGVTWTDIPLQVDPLDETGRLQFFDSDDFKTEAVSGNDYLSFETAAFGAAFDAKHEALPCRGPIVHELVEPLSGKYAYLTLCSGLGRPTTIPAVSYSESDHRLSSSDYHYVFNPNNYMQFKEISFRNPDGSKLNIAYDSKLMIRADVRKFFTMQFDSEEIVSNMESQRLGPVGDLARLTFYLKVLFFKIRMSLATDVGFYRNSGHIPMMVNLPVNSYDYLHPRSGILYTWRPGDAATSAVKAPGGGSPVGTSMPRLDPSEVGKGFESLGRIGLQSCRGEVCDFRYGIAGSGRHLSMDLRINRSLVERGFFPMYIDDAAKYSEAMGWDFKGENPAGRVGMYFEVSGLPKGGHPWDFWMSLGGQKAPQGGCPVAVQTKAIKNPKAKR